MSFTFKCFFSLQASCLRAQNRSSQEKKPMHGTLCVKGLKIACEIDLNLILDAFGITQSAVYFNKPCNHLIVRS